MAAAVRWHFFVFHFIILVLDFYGTGESFEK
jgi:hypothetical protein